MMSPHLKFNIVNYTVKLVSHKKYKRMCKKEFEVIITICIEKMHQKALL